MVGRPLVEATLSPSGQISNVKELQPNVGSQFSSNIRTLICPFPESPIVPGTDWQQDINLPLPEGTNETVKLTQTYHFEKEDASVVTINLETAPAEAIADKNTMVRVAQFLPSGQIKFDLSTGFLRSQNLKLSQTVDQFAGEGSVMRVTGVYTERLIDVVASSDARQF